MKKIIMRENIILYACVYKKKDIRILENIAYRIINKNKKIREEYFYDEKDNKFITLVKKSDFANGLYEETILNADDYRDYNVNRMVYYGATKSKNKSLKKTLKPRYHR